MIRARIIFGAPGVYLLGLVMTALAGLTMAGVLFYVFLLYVLFPLASAFLLAIAIARFRYSENFDTEHPVKGQDVSYTVLLSNETFLSSVTADVRFRIISPDSSLALPSLRIALKPRETMNHTYALRFPFRGIYTVGMDEIRISDSLRWLSFLPAVWSRTFYVYPRIVLLANVFCNLRNAAETSGYGQGLINDLSLFREIAPYRDGSPVKHMAWKKFAATGMPVLREYEKTSRPGVEIYPDMRRVREAGHTVLEQEDCTVEILVALVNYFLVNAVPVSVHACHAGNRFDFYGRAEADFASFYKSTVTLSFGDSPSPASIFTADVQDRIISAGTVIFITQALDPETLELLTMSAGVEISVFIIVNQHGRSSEEKDDECKHVPPQVLGSVIFVDDISSIKEDLET